MALTLNVNFSQINQVSENNKIYLPTNLVSQFMFQQLLTKALPFGALEKMHGYFQDVNGTFHVDGPGVFIPQDSSGVVPNAPEFSFLADHRCSKANSRPDSLALFCAGSCIRKGESHVHLPHLITLHASCQIDHYFFLLSCESFCSKQLSWGPTCNEYLNQ